MTDGMPDRRKADEQLIRLTQKFDDFVERYERDVSASSLRIAELSVVIKSHDEFIRDIKPMYTKSMVALGAFALGTIGLLVKWVWDHVIWR